MNLTRSSEPPVWRGAIIGASCFFLFAVLLRLYALTNPPSMIWLVAIFSVAGALVGHLGMKHISGLVGASFGLVAGLLVGAIAGDEVGYYLPIDEREGARPGQALEIDGSTLDGQPFDIKDWRGKVVLVDFWATWCAPCVAELPNVKRAYERYHKDGFEVVGVSLDTDRGRLSEFVKERELPWPQIISENSAERFWNSPMARKYRISSIPTMYLLDKEGKVAMGPTGETPTTAIEQLLTDSLHIGLFPMSLLLGGCLGAYIGMHLGSFCQSLVWRKRMPEQIA